MLGWAWSRGAGGSLLADLAGSGPEEDPLQEQDSGADLWGGGVAKSLEGHILRRSQRGTALLVQTGGDMGICSRGFSFVVVKWQ